MQSIAPVNTLPAMHSRAFRFALLLFEALWLNVIVPGHQRGAVPLPGESCAACQVQVADRECCSHHSQQKTTPAKEKGRGDPAQHCAICYFAARICPPPVIDLTPPPLRLVEQLPVPTAHTRKSFEVLPTYYGRAPPADLFHLA